jgi:lipopolysaccharide export system protein LptC
MMATRQTIEHPDGSSAVQTRPREIGLREAAFHRAQKHSRAVQFLKFALPVAAVLIGGFFAAYSYISVPGAVSFNITESAYTDGKLVMSNPKLDGFTKDSRPYSMTATRALQHVDSSGIVDLEGIDAKLPVGGKDFATIGAERGVYDRAKDTLDISSAITVKTTDGMTVLLKSALVEIGKGNMTTKDPVDIKTSSLRIVADAMSVLENGKVLIFEKRVKVNTTPDPSKAGKASTAESSTDNAQD